MPPASKEKSGPNLGGFKISEAVKRSVSPDSAVNQQRGAKDKKKKEETPSAGFPNIEHLIEGDHLDKRGLKARQDALYALSKEGDTKEKAAAKKALLAYKHAEELLDYLWSTKIKLGQPAPEAAAPAGKGGKATSSAAKKKK